jgi:branched-chain amino acid transport system ATP-binding protein
MSERAAIAATPAPVPLLEVDGLHAFYGKARALDDVNFRMERGSLAIVGRNGMGKTTLCNAIMGIAPPTAMGSIRFEGKQLVGGQSHRIARHGVGYVPPGRRLFPSLTVDEHLKIASRSAGEEAVGHVWTRERVYEFFPRLAERKRNGGAQLSGGEQQMLAIGRALVTNPRLLVMDEPSEGLAPAIIENMVETFQELEREGLSILLIEQNLGVATSLAERQLIMVAGSIAAETTADVLSSDSELQRRYLGVEPLAH